MKIIELTHSCEKQERVTYFFLFLIDLKIPLFDLKWLFSQSQCFYQNSQFDDVQFFNNLVNILMIFK